MDRLIKLPALVAVFAALALAGMIGIFAFNAAQPAEAAVTGVTVMTDNGIAGNAGSLYTVKFTTTTALATTDTITIIAPDGFDVDSTEGDDDTAVAIGTDTTAGITITNSPTDADRIITLGIGTAITANSEVTVVLSGIDNPEKVGMHMWTVQAPTPTTVDVALPVLSSDETTITFTLTSPTGGIDAGNVIMVRGPRAMFDANYINDTADDADPAAMIDIDGTGTDNAPMNVAITAGTDYFMLTIPGEDDIPADDFTVTVPAGSGASVIGDAAAWTGTTYVSGVTATKYSTIIKAGLVNTASASVDARPKDPGAATQVTVKFSTSKHLAIDDSITLEISDDLSVPGTIDSRHVSIAGKGTATTTGADAAVCTPSADPAVVTGCADQVAAPSSVVVTYDSPNERHVIDLVIGDMSVDDDGGLDDGLLAGSVTVTIRQSAGIMNRTEGGSDDWFVKTTEEGLAQITDVYTVPRVVELSSYGDSRGEEITAVAKGFKNGTTVRFWRDADMDGMVDPTEVVLCSAIASGDDIAECNFILSHPPFAPGDTMNYINAIDGRNQKATADLPQISLDPSMDVSPKEGSPGDSVNVQLYDFEPGDMVNKIDLGRSFRICDNTDADTTNNCPASWGTVGDDGGLSFSFDILNGVTPGVQQLRIFAGHGTTADHMTERDVDTNFVVGLGQLQLASTDVLPNQRISVSASGFTTSQGQAPAYIGRPTSAQMGSCSTMDEGMYYNGGVSLGGEMIPWSRVNDGDAIEVTSGGGWSGTIDLPVNSLTTTASTHQLKIIDCMAGMAVVDLTFPAREVTMSPEEGRVGSEVVITGKNFPVANDDASDNEVTVIYDATVDEADADAEPDALGNFTVIIEVPEDANIPSTNTVTVQFMDDGGVTVTETRTHRVPQGTVSFSADSGAEGSLLTITAEGFARYTSVDMVEFGDRDVTPSPKPGTGTTGDAEFDIRIPGADPGIYIIKVEIAEVTASQTFTVVSGSGVVDGSVETILANVISMDALDRVFKFDNDTKEWQWYINDPAFSATNNLAGLSSGDLIWIKVSKTVTADVLGTSVTLSCINEGMENEDCWNQISVP